MERYLLFAGNDYYPLGGINDLVGDYATEEEARRELELLPDYQEDSTWAHIVDITVGFTIKLR